MTRRLIPSGNPLEAQAGYSRAVVQGDWCFVAGTTGRDPATGAMPDDVQQQTYNAFAIIEAALAEAGFALTDVVRATHYIIAADCRTRSCRSSWRNLPTSARRRRCSLSRGWCIRQ